MDQLLWFKGHIPQQSFILWLAGLGRLCTMDYLHSVLGLDSIGGASSLQAGTHDHLFFKCAYSVVVWGDILTKALTPWPITPLQSLLQWATTNLRKKDFTHFLSRLVFLTIVYFIWYERNNRIFKQAYRTSQCWWEKPLVVALKHSERIKHKVLLQKQKLTRTHKLYNTHPLSLYI
ncbi:hypothetical protein NC651_032986 [Populus alba x Populus x berolinensis]|nr:hypothetical protein NC651_032986 [Populus alba x Populus x berolinensis]